MYLALLWFQLAASAVLILGASNFLARSADVIAEKTGLGRSFVGVVMLATATSLPELGTGVSAVALVGEVDLAAGDAFGSNLFNLLIIAVLDLVWIRRGPVLVNAGTTAILVGALGVGVISLASMSILVHGAVPALDALYLSPMSVALMGAFLVSMYLIYRRDRSQDEAAAPQVEQALLYESDSVSRALVLYGVSASVIVASAIWLSYTGDRLAEEMGWGASFIGTQFLALSTSLPELSASLAALRLNAPELAVTNLLGSNLFNMGFILFVDDVAYVQGALWSSVSTVHVISGVVAVFMTLVVILALAARTSKGPHALRFPKVEALFLLAAYLLSSYLVFTLST